MNNQFIEYDDKQLGQILPTVSPIGQKFLFYRRKQGQKWYLQDKYWKHLVQQFKPSQE